MHRLKSLMMSMNMFTLILLTVVVLLLLPMSFIIGYYSDNLLNLVMDFTVEQSRSTLNQLKNTVTMQTSQVSISFAALVQDDRFSDTLEAYLSGDGDGGRLETVRNLDRIIDSYLNSFSENTRSLLVIPESGPRFFYRHNLTIRIPSSEGSGLFYETRLNPNRVRTAGIEQSRLYVPGEDVVLLAIHPDIDSGLSGIAYIILALEPNIFQDMLIQTRQNDSRVYILDDEGRSVLKLANDTSPFSDSAIAQLRNLDEGNGASSYMDFPNGRALVTVETNHRNWLFMEAIPEGIIAGRIQRVSGRVLITALVIFTGFAIAFVFLIRFQLRPLKRLASHMDLSEGIPQTYHGELGSRETSTLAGSYNSMIDQIHRLIDEVKDNERRLRESEIEILLAQINPHFIINTLNCIRITAKLNRQTVLERMLFTLSRLLSRSLGSPNLYSVIDDELDFLEDYMEIMRLRYGDLFDFSVEVSEEIRSGSMLKFLLQPLVENSVVHGITKKQDPGRGYISLKMEREGEFLLATVSDNGCGMDFQSDIDGQNHFGIGLRSVSDRIRFRFGPPCGISIDDNQGEGTCIIVKVPFLSGEDVPCTT